MKYTIYNSNGSIDRELDVLPEHIHLNLEEGQSFIEGWFNYDEFYIHDGIAIPKEPKPGKWAQYDYIDKVWFDPRTASDLAQEFADAKTDAIAAINRKSNEVRKRYVTPLEGQTTVYQLKKEEGERFMSDPNPDLINYPLISAEVGITADTAENVAQVYLQLNDIYVSALAQLEKVRLGFIDRIESAENHEIINTVLAEFEGM